MQPRYIKAVINKFTSSKLMTWKSDKGAAML